MRVRPFCVVLENMLGTTLDMMQQDLASTKYSFLESMIIDNDQVSLPQKCDIAECCLMVAFTVLQLHCSTYCLLQGRQIALATQAGSVAAVLRIGIEAGHLGL